MPKEDRFELPLSTATIAAVESANSFEGNTAVYLKELFELKETATDLLRLLRGKVSAKSVSKLWLSLRYGLRLTAADSVELAHGIVRAIESDRHGLYQTSRGRVFTEDGYCSVIIYTDQPRANLFAQVCQFLYEWDLFPSLQNVWDFIPFSFVVDWFVDVEGFVSAIDARTHLSVIEVVRSLWTYKSTWRPGSGNLAGLKGDVSYSVYRRWTGPTPPDIIPQFSGSLPSAKNVLDGVSLIIQAL